MTRHIAHLRHHRRTAKHPAGVRSASPRAVETTLSQWAAQRRSRVRWFFSFLVFATLLFLSAQAFAQGPAAIKNEPINPELLKKARLTEMDQAHKEGIGKTDLSPQWEKFADFEAYYKQLIFGKMRDPAFVGDLGNITQSLLDDLDRAHRSRSPAAPLVRGYVLDIARYIAPGNYHPAARINATLLLALADDTPEDPRNRKPPVPASAAFIPLVSLYRDANLDAVKAAALQGIARHVSLGAVTRPEYRKGVATMMLQLAKSEPPAGRSPAAHAFMQRYAVDILSILAGPNVSPDTTNTLVALSTDTEKPSLIAAYAAAKISALQPGKQKLDNLPEVLKVWAGRAAKTVDGEIERIARLSPPVAVRDQPAMPTDDTQTRMNGYGSESSSYEASMMESGYSDMSGYDTMSTDSMYSEGMYGPGYGMMAPTAKPQPLEVISSRRRINHVLQQLQLGVTGQVAPGAPAKPAGLLGAANPADQAAFDAWITTISEVVTAVNAETLDDRTKFVTELTAQSAVLKKLAGIEVVPDAGAVVAGSPANPLSGPPGLAPAGAAPDAAGPRAAVGPAAAGPAAVGPAAVGPAGPVVPAGPNAAVGAAAVAPVGPAPVVPGVQPPAAARSAPAGPAVPGPVVPGPVVPGAVPAAATAPAGPAAAPAAASPAAAAPANG